MSCLRRLTVDLVALGADRLVIDTRQERDRLDDQVIRGVFGKGSGDTRLAYQHLESGVEPLLWIPDVVAWCYGADGNWRKRVATVIVNVVNLDESD